LTRHCPLECMVPLGSFFVIGPLLL
jgi:hypothetical protein